jgi:hypothetical protein
MACFTQRGAFGIVQANQTQGVLSMSSKRLAVILIGLSCAFGCKETLASKNIRTQGIAMEATVTATSETRSRVEVDLLAGGDESNTYIELGDGDRLFVVADGEEKEMDQVSEGEFEATFDVGAEDTLFEFRLIRSEFDDSTENSGTLPAPFDITSEYDEPVSRADDIIISWADPSDDRMDLEVDDETGESCIYSDDFRVDPDDGTFVVQGGTLDDTNDDEPESCTLTLELTRRRSGETDSVLDPESSIVMRQVRSVSVDSEP